MVFCGESNDKVRDNNDKKPDGYVSGFGFSDAR